MNIIDFKGAKCKHCYKCVRYCDVKAIMIKNERAEIIPEKCVLCGHCLQVCPQSAKTLVSDLDKVQYMIHRGETVIASIAPSYMGLLNYNSLGQVNAALRKLGFADVRETSEGAAFVTAEYNRLLEEGQMENIITTCCPSINDLIEIYYPSLVPYMAPVVSPMVAHGMILRKEYGPDARIVFIGPCIAKKKRRPIPDIQVILMRCLILTISRNGCLKRKLPFLTVRTFHLRNWIQRLTVCIRLPAE